MAKKEVKPVTLADIRANERKLAMNRKPEQTFEQLVIERLDRIEELILCQTPTNQ